MLAMEYHRSGHCYIDSNQEKNNYNVYHSKVRTSPRRDMSLEEEIIYLRNIMEEVFVEENSFTSETIVQISCMLDIKINEFMKRQMNVRYP